MVIALLGLVLLLTAAKPFPESEINPILSTSLQILVRQASGVQPQGQTPGTFDPNEEIIVILEPTCGEGYRISNAAVLMAGGRVMARSNDLVRVRVPINRLQNVLNNVGFLVYVREQLHPVPLAVVSQGVALTGASDYHDAGFEGQGAKIAIIDLGFDGLAAAQVAGELQNVVYTWDYKGNDSNVEGTGEIHGTGVAEIVEDMAPQAQLYLLRISDSVDLANATQYCINNGIQVINHSVGWYNSNYYDGTGVIGAIASNARTNDILWVNSAGNEAADGHWQGDFLDTDSDGYHDFGAGSDYLDGDSRDEGSRIYATSGDRIIIYMSWDDWTASNQDYDLYLYNSWGVQVASSANYQTGLQSPTEAIFYDVATTGYYEIVIHAYNAPQKPEIEFFAYLDSGADTGLEHHDPISSIITPANSADVLAVGAIRRTNWTTGPQESFSSQGPSNASKYASSRIKPDVSGPDGTSSYTYGSFYGTSASSPHVAGAAALLLSEDTGRTADDLQTLLESTAINMGAAGKDNIYGSGRINLAIDAPPPPPPPPAGGVAGYWELNEGSGSIASDSSGNGNNGTVVGASWGTSTDGSGALSFDGVNDYVSVPDDASLDVTSGLTVEAWVKLDVTGLNYIVDKRTNGANGWGFKVKDNARTLQAFVGNGSSICIVNSTGTIPVGEWVHVAFTYDTGTRLLEVYIDGVLSGQTTCTVSSIATNSGVLRIGAAFVSGYTFDGMMDEVRVTGEALEAGEFNLIPTGPTPPAPVTNFGAADGEDGKSTLTWTNPSDVDLAQVLVKRKEGGYPTAHDDGTAVTVYDEGSPVAGASVSYENTSLTNGTPYYYAVFSRDDGGLWNDTVSAGSNADTGTPSEPAAPSAASGYWRFNEGSGSIASDSSGNGNNGTVVGASWGTSTDGSGALSFDGVNDYVSVPDDASLDVTSGLTVEAWVKLDVTGLNYIVDKRTNGANGWGFKVKDNARTLQAFVGNGSSICIVNSTGTIPVGEWVHVAFTYDTGTRLLEVYIDGVLSGQTTCTVSSIATNSGVLRIGAAFVSGYTFDGMMDEVRVTGEALDPGEFNTTADAVVESAHEISLVRIIPMIRPNPVRLSPVTIELTPDVESMEIRIFALDGELVYETGWISGADLEWPLADNNGRAVANGVYLCSVRYRIQDGTTWICPIQKIFVIR
ncbi:LamG-like jellyroll fold domain-containing protein [Candidatus Bipolaricaulota bacterium]